MYDAGSGVLPLPKASVRSAEQLYEGLDAATSGWLRSCRALLDSTSAWPDLLVTHVVVGGSQLVPLLAKLLLARLDSCFGLTQVRLGLGWVGLAAAASPYRCLSACCAVFISSCRTVCSGTGV